MAVPLIAIVAILPGALVPEEWQLWVTLLTLLFAFGGAIMLFGKLRRWRTDKFFRIYFPTYRGVRIAAYSLIGYHIGIFSIRLAESVPTQIALSDEEMFFLNHVLSKRLHERNGGTLMRKHGGDGYWSFGRGNLSGIEVIERSDEAIKASAVDTRSEGERFVEGAAAHLLGAKVKHKIVPYVAYLVVTSQEPAINGDGTYTQQVTFAIPSEIEPEAFEKMGVKLGESESELINAAIDHVVSKVQGELSHEGENLLRGIVGDAPVDFADEIIDLKDDLDFLVNLGSAKIGSTDGARGRVMARLIAERLRAWSGLPHVSVSTINA